ncbi:hypothetical protein Dsin_001046 [Dipteronia sinensis]|uniref:Uncharacterized protein n=1 Tax=Dipteronia sinensis TaxID=43782 RepID=A0AAE0EJX9_9ROSI|nr:hypothetical protein Dsin_001046 [Dipteronia sinensis]
MKGFENDIKKIEELSKNNIKHLEELSENDIKQELSDNDNRERAQARSGKGSKNKDDSLTPEQCHKRDAKALQEKTAKKVVSGGDAEGKSSTKK